MSRRVERKRFYAAVDRRLDLGERAYGDASFARPVEELLGELEQEALDLAGWGFVLWVRIRQLKTRKRR